MLMLVHPLAHTAAPLGPCCTSLQVLLEVLNQGSAASLPSGQHLVWLERLLTLGELLLEEAQPSEELRHELLSAITAIVLRAVELPTADVAGVLPCSWRVCARVATHAEAGPAAAAASLLGGQLCDVLGCTH